MTKRLVLCLDGTWNSPDQGRKSTNVVKIMEAIPPTDAAGTRQITFYDAGIGADAGRVDRIVDGFTGRGLEQNVRDGYRFLANNWERGDEIYLFGFSRGAFTARSLCGFLSACGLLERHAMRRLLEAWELYRQPEDQRDPDKLAALRAVSRCDVRVKCIGVWDTVGALGVPGELWPSFNREHQFHDTELCEMVECAFHAVAIDEKRGPFGPTLWQKRKGESLKQRVVEQVWFPGVHSNIGGSCPDAGLSDLALLWMIRRIQAHTRLAFDERYISAQVTPDPLAEIYEFAHRALLRQQALPLPAPDRSDAEGRLGVSASRSAHQPAARWLRVRERDDSLERNRALRQGGSGERQGTALRARKPGEGDRQTPDCRRTAPG